MPKKPRKNAKKSIGESKIQSPTGIFGIKIQGAGCEKALSKHHIDVCFIIYLLGGLFRMASNSVQSGFFDVLLSRFCSWVSIFGFINKNFIKKWHKIT